MPIYGVVDLSVVDTSFGGDSVFAPPRGWTGDYGDLMRQRFADPGARQQMAVLGRRLADAAQDRAPRFRGPFSAMAEAIARKCI